MNEVANIYDNLFSFESKKKGQSYPIHKKLKFDHFKSIPDWLISEIEFNDGDRILDVGCGTGYTLFTLNQSKSILGKGISISPKEIAFANAQNESPNLTFEVQDFDMQLPIGEFDKIIAIESLKHSKDIKALIDNFSKHLSSNGIIIIADDFIINDNESLKRHKEYWKADSFCTLEVLKSYLKKSDTFDLRTLDLTDKVPSRSSLSLLLLIGFFSLLKFITLGNSNRNIKTYLGGLLLERLYALRKVNYNVLIAKKSK